MSEVDDENARDESIREVLLGLNRVGVSRRPGFVCFKVTSIKEAGLDIGEVAGFVKRHDGFVDMPEQSLRGLLPDGPEMAGYESSDVVTFEIPARAL